MILLFLPLLALASEPPRNEVSAHLSFPFPRWGAAIGVQRAVAQRLSLSAQLETVVPTRGFLHLPGFEEIVGMGIWLRRFGVGPYLSPMVSLAQSFFYRLPEQSRHAIRLGAEAGWRFSVSPRLSVGAGLGGQWGWAIGQQASICTYDYQCASTRPGGIAKARVTVGVRW